MENHCEPQVNNGPHRFLQGDGAFQVCPVQVQVVKVLVFYNTSATSGWSVWVLFCTILTNPQDNFISPLLASILIRSKRVSDLLGW